MNHQRHDSIIEFDLSTITFSDLCWRYGTGIDTSTGKGYYKVHSYRNGVMTKLGDIEIKVWCELMNQLIEKEDEQWLLAALEEWQRENCYNRKNPNEIREAALEMHSMRIFDRPGWVHFLPFNKRFRPETLEQIQTVIITTACCKQPVDITLEQLEGAYKERVHCPLCGCWSKHNRSKEGE